jgi:ribose/xylose/arabinose/galactoside ABC-type transport system permease subunit
MKKETKLSISQVFVYLVLLFVFVFFSVLTKTFLSTKNLLNICRQVSMTGICAVGMTMVLLTGGIDISIGFPALSPQSSSMTSALGSSLRWWSAFWLESSAGLSAALWSRILRFPR